MDKILEMLQLQQQLNNSTNGEGWESGITQNGKLIDWKRCSYLECAELIESYPWKHWKDIDAQADYENIKIETVDIWHFIMSEALREYKVENLGDINTLRDNISSMANFDKFRKEIVPRTENYYKEIKVVEILIKSLFCDRIDDIILKFIDVAIQSELNLDSLYNLYIGKNILNKFRQDNGYKEGSYIKIWSGKEDNVIMQSILKENERITPSELYKKLNEAYPV